MKCIISSFLLLLVVGAFNINGYTDKEMERIKKYGFAYVSWMQVVSIKGDCVFHDYAVGGSAAKEVSKLSAPVATLEANVLSSIIGSSKVATAATMHTINTVKGMVKFLTPVAPVLAPALGLMGAFLGGLGMSAQTNPKDIIASTNRAFEEMTREINERFSEMKGYVDARFLEFERNLMEKDLQVMYRLWTYCLNEANPENQNSALNVNECQRDAYKHIYAQEDAFIDTKDVQVIEAALLPFREYAHLSIIVLSTLMRTYKLDSHPNSKFYHKFFNTELERLTKKFVTYAQEAVKFIKNHHAQSKKAICTDSIECGSVDKQWWFSQQTCSCKMGKFNDRTCQIDFKRSVRSESSGWIVLKSNFSENVDQMKEFALNQLHKKAREYQPQELKAIEEYWDRELLVLVPIWKEAGGDTVNDVTYVIDDEEADDVMTDSEMDEIPFSDGYHDRLKKARK